MIAISVVAAALAVTVGLLAWRLRATRAEAATAGARLAAMLESFSAGLAVWSPEGRLTACNGRFREFYPAVELKPGLEYEDFVRYAATRAIVLVPEAEIDAWIEARLDRFGEGGGRDPAHPRRTLDRDPDGLGRGRRDAAAPRRRDRGAGRGDLRGRRSSGGDDAVRGAPG